MATPSGSGIVAHEPPPEDALLVLLVEDEAALRRTVERFMVSKGMRVTAVPNLWAAREVATRERFDVIVLDVLLPDGDGRDFMQELAAVDSPIIIITSALSEEADRLRAFEGGADDYMAKPFSLAELAARIRSAHRRRSRPTPPATRRVARFDAFVANLATRTLVRDESEVVLTKAENALLGVLLEHGQQVLSRASLSRVVGSGGDEGTERTVDVLIARLRRKLGDSGVAPRIIRTVRGEGYCLSAGVSWEP